MCTNVLHWRDAQMRCTWSTEDDDMLRAGGGNSGAHSEAPCCTQHRVYFASARSNMLNTVRVCGLDWSGSSSRSRSSKASVVLQQQGKFSSCRQLSSNRQLRCSNRQQQLLHQQACSSNRASQQHHSNSITAAASHQYPARDQRTVNANHEPRVGQQRRILLELLHVLELGLGHCGKRKSFATAGK